MSVIGFLRKNFLTIQSLTEDFMGKKQRTREHVMAFNHQAIVEGASKKHFTIHDLKTIYPKTDNQRYAFESYFSGNNLALLGSAGTGKTFIGLYLALTDVLGNDSRYQKVIIVRSAVSSRNIGFLPGSDADKLAVYEEPYYAVCDELFEYSKSYDNLKKGGYVEFKSTSNLRGTTFNDSIVLVDEVQNLNLGEISTVITRLGRNSKIIFCGDTKQDDLENYRNDLSGLPSFIRILEQMKEFDIVKFCLDDIVRSKLVKSFLVAKEKLNL